MIEIILLLTAVLTAKEAAPEPVDVKPEAVIATPAPEETVPAPTPEVVATERAEDPAPTTTRDRKSTRLNSSHSQQSRMPSSA